MVAPQWGTFARPGQHQLQQEEISDQNEFIQEEPGKIQDERAAEGEKPQWGNFDTPSTYQGEPDPTADEGMFDYILRNTASLASRAAESIAGKYGNIEKFGKDLLVNHPWVGGPITWGLSELMGPEKWENMVRGPGHSRQMLPTSQQLKEASYELTEGYTKPKTKGEARLHEFTEDVASTLSPSRRAQAINNLLIPAAANVAKAGVEELGFGEDKANLVKFVVWTPLSLAHNVNAPRYASNLMNQGRNGIPNNVAIDVGRMQNRLQQVSRDPHLLSADPRTALARQELAAIERDLANGQTSVRSMMTTYDGINAAKRNRDLFSLNRNDQAFARRAIDRVRDVVRDEIMDSGQAFPQALNDWRNGIQAWSVIHQSNAISRWVDQLANGPYAKLMTGPAAALFGVGSIGAYKAPIVAVPASAIVPAGYKTGQTLYRIWNDRRLATYYWNSIRDAQIENAPAFINNYQKLNKELEKSEAIEKKRNAKKNQRINKTES